MSYPTVFTFIRPLASHVGPSLRLYRFSLPFIVSPLPFMVSASRDPAKPDYPDLSGWDPASVQLDVPARDLDKRIKAAWVRTKHKSLMSYCTPYWLNACDVLVSNTQVTKYKDKLSTMILEHDIFQEVVDEEQTEAKLLDVRRVVLSRLKRVLRLSFTVHKDAACQPEKQHPACCTEYRQAAATNQRYQRKAGERDAFHPVLAGSHRAIPFHGKELRKYSRSGFGRSRPCRRWKHRWSLPASSIGLLERVGS